MIPSVEGWPTKAKEARSPHEVRLNSLDTNPVFQCLGDKVVVENTNLYSVQRTTISINTSTDEIGFFIGMHILMDIVQLPNTNDNG